MKAPYVLEYAYKRSTGPTTGAFLTALRAGRILGGRTRTGRVVCPPAEYDPATGEELEDLVEVGPGGVVTTWSEGWALVRLDGADTALFHRLDVREPRAGLRVAPRWRVDRRGHVDDIEAFVEESAAEPPSPDPGGDPVTRFKAPVRLDYTVSPGVALSRSLSAMLEGRILGGRCGVCAKVYVPLRGACPVCGVPLAEDVELPPTGTLTTFCVINIPFEGQVLTPPYVGGAILLDGADVPLFHLVGGVSPGQVRMGMRVRARWGAEPQPSLAAIEYFEPTGEPDAPFDTYKSHL